VYSDLYHTRLRMDWAYAYGGFVDRLSAGDVFDLIIGYLSYGNSFPYPSGS